MAGSLRFKDSFAISQRLRRKTLCARVAGGMEYRRVCPPLVASVPLRCCLCCASVADHAVVTCAKRVTFKYK